MEYFLKFDPKPNQNLIDYNSRILLIGSCFTEHIGGFLQEHKFNTLQNPNGILFDTLSVCRALTSYIENKPIDETSSFYYNELWQHWHFHSRFSHQEKTEHIRQINNSISTAHQFLKETNFLIITLGSSFAYQLVADENGAVAETQYVANCHKAPGHWFEKYLIPIEEQIAQLDNVIHRLRMMKPDMNIIFTISPVRHIRDGVVENNRSKARLLETVHHLVNKFNNIYYLPAYEMIIDVLRDYRFYDIDYVHPNYAATQYVIKQFITTCLTKETAEHLEAVKQIVIAAKHRPFNPHSVAHTKFKLQQIENIKAIQAKLPQLNFDNELAFFSDIIV